MFARFLPHEGDFFALFSRHAELMVTCSREVVALIADPSQAGGRAHAVKTLESEADGVTRETVRLLHKTFITPLDRDRGAGVVGRVARADAARSGRSLFQSAVSSGVCSILFNCRTRASNSWVWAISVVRLCLSSRYASSSPRT